MGHAGPDIGPAFPSNDGARTIMHRLHEFIPLAVAALNLITVIVNQRSARRRPQRDRRPVCGNKRNSEPRS